MINQPTFWNHHYLQRLFASLDSRPIVNTYKSTYQCYQLNPQSFDLIISTSNVFVNVLKHHFIYAYSICDKWYIWNLSQPKLTPLSTYVISYINKGNSLFFYLVWKRFYKENNRSTLFHHLCLFVYMCARHSYFMEKEDSVGIVVFALPDRTFPHKRI